MSDNPAVNVEWPAGWRINPRPESLNPELVEAFGDMPVSAIGDAMSRNVGTMGLNRYHGQLETVMCGPALTVRVRPGDNLMIHKALMMAKPGDVLVVDGGGDLTQALVGGLIRTTCVTRRLAGLVINGAIRDLAEWAEPGMPIFAKGHTHRGPSKDGPGEVNVVVSCAGLVIRPGDLVVGDADGVIAVPADEAETVLRRTRAHLVKEEAIRLVNQSDNPDTERFDSILRAKGLPIP